MNNIIEENIKKKIFLIRNVQVMIDRDLAELYGVLTKVLNQAVKRNKSRFPEDFSFQLTELEKNELVTNCDHLNFLKYSYNLPYAFTEQGVAMLSTVINSEIAVKISIQIIKTFVLLRKIISSNSMLAQRIEILEDKQMRFQIETKDKFDKIFTLLENPDQKRNQGIFYEGQIFDSHVFISDLIKSAKHKIVLLDNYVDESTLMLFNKRNKNIEVIIYTKINSNLKIDLQKYNSQYFGVELKEFNLSHDRFLIIDDKQIYHIGASLKDLGKKWFAFSKLDKENLNILDKLK